MRKKDPIRAEAERLLKRFRKADIDYIDGDYTKLITNFKTIRHAKSNNIENITIDFNLGVNARNTLLQILLLYNFQPLEVCKGNEIDFVKV